MKYNLKVHKLPDVEDKIESETSDVSVFRVCSSSSWEFVSGLDMSDWITAALELSLLQPCRLFQNIRLLVLFFFPKLILSSCSLPCLCFAQRSHATAVVPAGNDGWKLPHWWGTLKRDLIHLQFSPLCLLSHPLICQNGNKWGRVGNNPSLSLLCTWCLGNLCTGLPQSPCLLD